MNKAKLKEQNRQLKKGGRELYKAIDKIAMIIYSDDEDHLSVRNEISKITDQIIFNFEKRILCN